MAKISVWSGILLVLLGIVGYIASDMVSITALIPAFFGAGFIAAGLVGRRETMRRHAMHAGAALALIGFFGSVGGLFSLPALLSGAEVARPAAVIARSIMSVLCLGFVVLAVKSFIDARTKKPSV